MKKITLNLLLLFGVIGFAQTDNSEFDRMVEAEMKSASATINFRANPNTQNYDISYHELRFSVDPNNTTPYISGVVTTTFTALSDMSVVTFDMATALVVSSVTMNSSNLTFSQSNYELNINLPATLATGNSATVVITYAGSPPQAEGAFTRGTHSGTPVIFTLSEPYGARDWWPCKQDLNDKVNTIDVYITAPSAYVSVSNGIEVSQTVSGANKTTHFHHNYPIPAYLIAIAITNYQIYNQQGGLGTVASPYFPIVNYLYPESYASATSATQLGTTPTIINLYESLLEPYPFRNEKYGHAQFGWGGGMEHTTVSFMGSFGRSLIAHEMAHQWFGNKITCGSWKDIWLNEGLTEYMSGLVVENLDGAPLFVTWKTNKINSITSQTAGYVYLQDSDLTNVNRIFSSRLTYDKGSMVTHMLRWKLGDAAFFQALKNYLADSSLAYGYALTGDLKSHLENVYGSSLTEFFNDWIYMQGYPTYTITAQNWGAGQAKITVSQTQSHASVSFFEMPLEIRLTSAGGANHDVVVNNTVNNQEFVVPVPFVVAGVTFDPNKHIISKNNVATLSNESFDLDQTISVYPNPAHDELNIMMPTTTQLEKIEIYNTLGQLLATHQTTDFRIDNLSSGIHVMKITTSEGAIHKNFIKK
ncbi:M1 family aminopeptidase [uncultured Flavobacterium sp.]|uniref:M1 family aminopeptidase n=1 Tax=uncultured Flavobacterium sp. TaxID=165435 RepID=UPI00261660DC|nr:M1 family aminopeptidase [uncultured Flavobacterium sp.]